jgi:hypothetical protein
MNAKTLALASLFVLGACGDGPGHYSIVGGEAARNGGRSDTDDGSAVSPRSAADLPADFIDTPLFFLSTIVGARTQWNTECDPAANCEVGELVLYRDGTFSWDALAEFREDGVTVESYRYCEFGIWNIEHGVISFTDSYGTLSAGTAYDYFSDGRTFLLMGSMVGFPLRESLPLPGACQARGNPLEPWE